MASLVESVANLNVGGRELQEVVADNPELFAFLRDINEFIPPTSPEISSRVTEQFTRLKSKLSFDVTYGRTFDERKKASDALAACGIIQIQVIDKLKAGSPEKGTKNLGTFFTSVYRPEFWSGKFGVNEWEKLTPSQKTEAIWDYIEKYVIMAQTTGTSPWMPVDIIHKEVEGLPDKATIDLLISSLRLQGGEHEGLADRLETDLYRIQKIFRIGHALQNKQKSSTELADFFRDKNNLFSTEETRDLAKLGDGYTNPPIAERFVQAIQLTHALNRPEWKKVFLKKQKGVYNYPISSKYAWWPQTAGKNIETRMQIRRAMGSISTDPVLQGFFQVVNPEQKLTQIKQYLGQKIEEMKDIASQKGSPGEIWYSLDPVEQKTAANEASGGALYEMLATNFAELNLISPQYDAGKPIPAGADVLEGLPVLDDIFGFSATFVPTKNAYATLYRMKLRKEGGEGTPGPEVSDGFFPKTGYSILEYFYCEAPPKADVLEPQRETLLSAMMRVNNAKDFQEIFSRNAFGDMSETSQGTMEMFFSFFDKYIITLGIPWKSIKQPVPGSNGAGMEFNPEVGKKVQKMARDVYYLLVRGQYEGRVILQNPKIKPEDFSSKTEFAEYTRLERNYRNAPDKQAFLAGLGGDRLVFEARYKKLNNIPASGFRLYDGFQDVTKSENYVRFASRFIDEMVHVPRHADGKIFSKDELIKAKDIFAAEIFYPSDGLPIDYYSAIQKFYIGRLIIADILGQGQSQDVDWDDTKALLGILVQDFWKNETSTWTAQIRRTLTGRSQQILSYEGYGKYTYPEAIALLEMAGIPVGKFAQLKGFYKGVVSKEK